MLSGGEERSIRVLRIWSRLSSGRSFLSQRSWWKAADGGSLGTGLAAMVVGLSAPVEATLWGNGWPGLVFQRLTFLPGRAIAIGLVGVWLLGTRFYDRHLRLRIPETSEVRVWYRIGRSLVAGFPGFGVGLLPLWRHLAERQPRWAYRARSAPRRDPMESRAAAGRLHLLALSERSAFILWLGGITALLLALLWLAAPSDPTPGRRIALFAVAGSLHVLGCGGTVLAAQAHRRRGGSRAHFLFAAFWILPQPFALGAFGSLACDLHSGRDRTLAWTAYARHNQSGRLARWTELERAARRAWRRSPWWVRWDRPVGRRPRREATALDRELLRLGGAKLSLLLADGVAVGWSGLRISGADPRGFAWLVGLVLAVLMVAGCGLLIVLVGHVAATLHLTGALEPLGRLRQVWSGTIAVSTLGLGCALGIALAIGDHRDAGVVLVQGSFLALLALAFGMILQVPFAVDGSGGFDFKLSWCGLLLGLMVVGGLIAALPGAATGFLLAALAAPIWHALFLWTARGKIERCYQVGGEALSRDGEPIDRSVWLVKATAGLPLGGLAVPWWLSLRNRWFGPIESSR